MTRTSPNARRSARASSAASKRKPSSSATRRKPASPRSLTAKKPQSGRASTPAKRPQTTAGTRRSGTRAPRRAPLWWTQEKPVTSSVRFPRLAATAFLLGVTVVTLLATLGILWLFVPEVAARTVDQVARSAAHLADVVRTVATALASAG